MNNALGGLCVSSRERVSPKLVESIPIIHHPWPKITKEGNSQETAREYAPIHCNHPCIIKRCFGAVRGALGSILLPPKGIRPNNSHPKELERGHKKNDQKSITGPLPRQAKVYAPYWVRLGYFARKASVFSMPFSIAGGRAMMIGVFTYVVGYYYA